MSIQLNSWRRCIRRTMASAVLLSLGSPALAVDNLPKFPPGAVWNRNISNAPLNINSGSMISTLSNPAGLNGWGNGNKFQIDFSIVVVHAAPNAPTKPLIGWPSPAEYAYGGPDCDAPGMQIPVPVGGAIEGSAGYTCTHDNDDCHYIVVQGNNLFEAYKANVTAQGLESLCAMVWHLDKVYPPEGRGEQCTSVDAAGFPVGALLFNPDDITAALLQGANSDLGHAIRFVLPNDHIANARYVHPGSHGTKPPGGASGPTGPTGTIPYASRLRLKTPYQYMATYNAAAQVVLRTMQRYGIVLADGGNIALTAESDQFNTVKWNDPTINIDSQTFNPHGASQPGIKVTDFDVVETGDQIPVTYDCIRGPDDFIYIDRFDY